MKIIYLILLLIFFLSIGVYAHETGQSHLELPAGLLKQIEYQNQLALGVTFLIALLAGILTFTSPCSFVILPLYFSFVFKEKKKAMLATSSFVLGLTIAFAIFGLVAGLIGNYFNNYKLYLASISGIFIILFGIMMIFNKGFSFFTPKVSENKKGVLSFILFGFLFGVGWSPCVGPILGSIFFLAASSGTLIKSILLLITYSMGISIPLLIFAYFSDRINLSSLTSRMKSINFSILGEKFMTNIYNIIFGIITVFIGIITFFYKGTTYVEYIVSYTTGWVMLSFIDLNDKIRNLNINSNIGNIIGIFLALVIIFIILIVIIKGIKKRK